MKKSIILLATFSSFLVSSVDIKSIDLYKNKIFVNQNIDVSKKEMKLINVVNFEDIRFIKDGNCIVHTASTDDSGYKNDDLSLKIEEYKKNLAFLENEKNSILSANNSLKSVKFEDSAVTLNNIKSVSSFIQEELYKSANQIYKIENEKRNLKKELDKLESRRSSNKYSSLKYDISCEQNSKIYLNYPMYNLQGNSFYHIDENSKKDLLNIKNISYITQNSGYDFKNIDINLFTYNYNSQIFPQKFNPIYLDVYQNRKVAYQRDMAFDEMAEVAPMAKSIRKQKAPSFSYNQTATKSFFKASHIDLKSGVKTPVVFANEKYKTKTSNEIMGFSNTRAFYKVEFKSKKLLSSLNTKFYLDSIYIGRRYIPEIKKDKDSYLYFGENRFIDVKKDLLKDMSEKPFFSIGKIKTEKLWRYTIVNSNKKAEFISLIERVPVSKNEDIKVKITSKSKYTKLEKNGKVIYDFVLKPNETKTIEFGYEVEKPYKK